jgi:hypothetical protein
MTPGSFVNTMFLTLRYFCFPFPLLHQRIELGSSRTPGSQFQSVLSVPLLAIQTAVNGRFAAPSGRCTEIKRLLVSESFVFRSETAIDGSQSHFNGGPSTSF